MLGKLLKGRYQVVQILCQGEFCHTYLALDTCQTGSPNCVVKHLRPLSNHSKSLPTLRNLFTREAQALQKLGNYDQVPQLVDRFEEDQDFYLVQEFILGHPLSLELQPGYRWRERHVVQMLQEVLRILEVIHSQGLIHRDLKPSNLIRRQQDCRLVLIDFGSVKQALPQLVTNQEQSCASLGIGIPSTVVIGTPGYMPTEQGRGRPRPSSDIYALGIMGIQALTGLHPAQLLEDSDSGEFIWQHQAMVSPGLAFVLNKMVRYHFRDRYQSATEVLQALQQLNNFSWPHRRSATTIQPSTQPKTQQPATPLPSQDVSSLRGNPSKPPLGNQTSVTSVPKRAHQPALLVGLGIGVASTLVLVFSSYYILRSPTLAPKLQNSPVSVPNKNALIENISLSK